MTTLQSAFEDSLQSVPYQFLASTISEKLAGQGIVLSARQRERLVQHLRSSPEKAFRFSRWRWWDDRNVAVDLTDTDIQAISDRFEDFIDGLPELLRSTLDELSFTVLQSLKRGWHTEWRRQERDREGFKRRLYERWSLAIDRLRMTLVIARELGEMTNSTVRSEPNLDRPLLADILTRLHARACLVADEIACLVEAGFADGAMARWRTLHEIAVVAFFLKENNEELVQRYIDHQAVESYKAACEYRECSDRLGYEPMTDVEFDQIRAEYDRLVHKYGRPFATPYGWASEALANNSPGFSHIEQAAGIDHLRAHYRMASHNVHANPRGVFFKLGLMEGTEVLLAGSSNAGLADPGHCAAISLMHVSSTLASIMPSVDLLLGLRVLNRLVDEVGAAFGQAQRQLEEEVNRQE